MKIRKGFVSNSSSSSFLIYGVCLDEEKHSKSIYEYLMKNAETEKDKKEIRKYCNPESDDYNQGKISKYLYYIKDLEFNYSYEKHYLGISPKSQLDEMTHGDWKKEIKEKLIEVCGDKVKTDWHG